MFSLPIGELKVDGVLDTDDNEFKFSLPIGELKVRTAVNEIINYTSLAYP